MSTPLHGFIYGNYTSDGAARTIEIPSDVDYFMLLNQSNFDSTANPGVTKRAWWIRGLADDAAYTVRNTNAAATDQSDFITVGGFTALTTADPATPSAAVAITSTSNADPVVVATGSTAGLANTDVVRIYGITGAQQLSGIDWTIGSLIANTSFELSFTGVAPGSAGTAGFWRRIPFDPMFYPRRRFITFISQAASAVIEMSVTHQFTVGQSVRVMVPAGWGMTQINNQVGTITAISVVNNTITVNIDSTAFTAFAYPTSAIAAGGVTQPQVVPLGEAAINTVAQPYANLLDDATDNRAIRGLRLGTVVVGANTDVVRWVASKGMTL